MKNYYCNSVEMLAELKEWQKTRSRRAYEALGLKFLLIAQNLLNLPRFINYTQDRKDDMVSESIMVTLKYIADFDTTRVNPFAYFTKVAYNSFLQTIKRFKKHSDMLVPIDIVEQSTDFTFKRN